MDIFIWLWLGAIVLFGVAEVVTEGKIGRASCRERV